MEAGFYLRTRRKAAHKQAVQLFLVSPGDTAGVAAFSTLKARLLSFQQKKKAPEIPRSATPVIQGFWNTCELLICLDAQNTAGPRCITTSVTGQQ